MKRLILFLFASQTVLAQVTTLPSSIGIGANTLSSIPLHINATGEIARFQGVSPYVSFYNNSLINGYIQAINNTFELGSKNSYNLNFFTGDALRMSINGTTGMVTFSQKLIAQNGIKLTGPLQAEGESVGAEGMILVSKGNNTPAWEERRIAFSAYLPTNKTIGTSLEYPFDNLSERFDYGNNFNPVTGDFTVPSDGLYNFIVNTMFNASNDYTNVPIKIRLYRNDSFHMQYEYTINFKNTEGTGTSSTFILKCNEGDVLNFRILQSSGVSQVLSGYWSTITVAGYKVF